MAVAAGYPNSFSAAGFHDVIMPLLSTITIASSGAAAVHRYNPDALPDAKPPCGGLLSTFSILCRGQLRDPAPTAAATSSGHKALSKAWSATIGQSCSWSGEFEVLFTTPFSGGLEDDAPGDLDGVVSEPFIEICPAGSPPRRPPHTPRCWCSTITGGPQNQAGRTHRRSMTLSTERGGVVVGGADESGTVVVRHQIRACPIRVWRRPCSAATAWPVRRG
jgi:hypothetical protein